MDTNRHECRDPKLSGFTLIELLTAMAVLSVIVVAVANLFSHSATAWDSGTRRARSLLVGRALTDYFVREGANTMFEANGTPVSVESPYSVLKGVDAWSNFDPDITSDLFQDDTSGGQQLTAVVDNGATGFGGGTTPPRLFGVKMTITTTDKGRDEPRVHTGRAYLWNRNRYRFD